jgi:hypothetical protein
MSAVIGRLLNLLSRGVYRTTAQVLADGETNELALSRDGRLLVADRDPSAVLTSRSPSLEASRRVKVGAGSLLALTGSTEASAARWLMLFDSDDDPPADNTDPLECFRLAPGSSFSYEPPAGRLDFSTGLVWAISTAADTLALDPVNTTRLVVAYQ